MGEYDERILNASQFARVHDRNLCPRCGWRNVQGGRIIHAKGQLAFQCPNCQTWFVLLLHTIRKRRKEK